MRKFVFAAVTAVSPVDRIRMQESCSVFASTGAAFTRFFVRSLPEAGERKLTASVSAAAAAVSSFNRTLLPSSSLPALDLPESSKTRTFC